MEVVIEESRLPKYHAHALKEQRKLEGPQFGDYQNSSVTFNWQDDYEFVTKIGRGRYSEVYEAMNLLTNQRVVVKMLKPVKKEKVRREIMALQAVAESPYTINLLD